MYKKIAVLLGLSFWPISLFLHNTSHDFLSNIIPTILIGLSFFLFKKDRNIYLFPLLLIPIFEPKLTLLPLLTSLADILWGRQRIKIIVLLLSLLLIPLFFKSFAGQTIFRIDQEAQQKVIGKTYLYPHPLIARIYQNKLRVVIDRLTDNFFALTDPNNYFFGFHPREIIVENQNLKKFSFVGLIFPFFGLYHFLKLEEKRFVIVLGIASLVSLSLLTNFDRADIILWIPLGMLFVHGINMVYKKTKIKTLILIFYFFFAFQELLRIFLT